MKGRQIGADVPLRGRVRVPGDKSISHRALILAGLARGRSTVRGTNLGLDVRATAAVLGLLGAPCIIDDANAEVEVEGCGWEGLTEPSQVLDAGNSGTTLRMLLGVCAGLEHLCVLTGDASLRRRPMFRVVAPLRRMGARIEGRQQGDLAPLVVRGGNLQGGDFELSVSSAQVKSALLLAGLRAAGSTTVTEPQASRDHTERMLEAAGAQPLHPASGGVQVIGGAAIARRDWTVPGDISSALFLLAAAAMVPNSDVTVEGVGINPTRCAGLDVMRRMGVDLEVEPTDEVGGEPRGRVTVRASALRATSIGGSEVVGLIDEIPMLAVLASQAEGETVIRDAGELRVKESDRIGALVEGLTTLGADAESLPDGLVVRGPARLTGGKVASYGDHRIALSFAVAGLVAREHVRVEQWSAVDTSFPEFLELVGQLRSPTRMKAVTQDDLGGGRG